MNDDKDQLLTELKKLNKKVDELNDKMDSFSDYSTEVMTGSAPSVGLINKLIDLLEENIKAMTGRMG